MSRPAPIADIEPLRQYAARVRIFDAIFAGAREARLSPMDFWRPTVERLRYNLGTGLGDACVPIAIAEDIPKTFDRARQALLGHFVNRHRKLMADSAYDSFIAHTRLGVERTPAPFFAVPHGVTNPRLRTVVGDVIELCPYLDSGVVMGWISGKAPGMALLQAMAGALRKAVAEGVASGEETPYLLQLYLLRHLADARRLAREEALDGALAGHAESALAVGFHAMHYAAVEQVLAEREEAGAPPSARLQMLMRTLVNPVLVVGISSALRRVSATLYGIDATFYRELGGDQHLRHLSEGGQPSRKPEELVKAIGADAALRGRVEDWLGVDVLRQTIRGALADERWVQASDANAALRTQLWELYREPNRAAALLKDKKAPGELARQIEIAEQAAARTVAASELANLRGLLKRYKPSAPLKTLGKPGEAALSRFVHGFTVMLCDLLVERAIHPVSEILQDRGVVEHGSELEEDYQSGRLYLVSKQEERPILAQRAAPPHMAHLFVDIKDFTRRTVLLQEDVMAEHLDRQFYTPILAAAREHCHGGAHYWDKGGLILNNVLGDAMSFSGDVVSLVQLARQIRRILGDYQSKLQHMLTADVLQPILVELEARYANHERAIDRELEQIDFALAEAAAGRQTEALALQTPGDLEARRRWLLAEKQRLGEEKEQELEAIRGADLQAGIFIAFGPAPRLIELDDPVWGVQRVAIASKINESARGTGRTAALRAWIDEFVAEQATRPGYDRYTNPFRVLIGGVMGAPEGFYNIGCGVSLECLRAYIEATHGRLMFTEHAMGGHEVLPEVVRRFCLPRGRLDLVVGLDASTGEISDLFVYSGAARFKGFESRGTTDVYELVPPDAELFQTLVRLHLPQWRRQAAADAGLDPGLADGGGGAPGMVFEGM